MRKRVKQVASVGVAEHGNSAVLVTVAPDGTLLEPIDVLLEIVQEVVDVHLPRPPAHDAALQLSIERIVEAVAALLDARNELLDVAVRQPVGGEGG